MSEHSYKSEIKCPYCDHEQSDPYEYNLRDGDCESIQCGSCEKHFDVKCSISVKYSTVGDCESNKELPHELDDHSFDHSGKKVEVYKCKKCFNEYYVCFQKLKDTRFETL
jgi:hypothetical protein